MRISILRGMVRNYFIRIFFLLITFQTKELRKQTINQASIETFNEKGTVIIFNNRWDRLHFKFQCELIFRFYHMNLNFYHRVSIEIISCESKWSFLYEFNQFHSRFFHFFTFSFSIFVAECKFGEELHELDSKWPANLGPPFGIMHCIECSCIPVSGFSCFIYFIYFLAQNP